RGRRGASASSGGGPTQCRRRRRGRTDARLLLPAQPDQPRLAGWLYPRLDTAVLQRPCLRALCSDRIPTLIKALGLRQELRRNCRRGEQQQCRNYERQQSKKATATREKSHRVSLLREGDETRSVQRLREARVRTSGHGRRRSGCQGFQDYSRAPQFRLSDTKAPCLRRMPKPQKKQLDVRSFLDTMARGDIAGDAVADRPPW